MSEHKCEGKIWGHTKYLPCSKTARYEHEGRWYCKRHHPPTVQEKLDARDKKFEEDWKSRLQAAKEADEARAEMRRKAAAYDGLIAQRDALLEALEPMIDLAEFWINHRQERHMSEEQYRVWLALGHESNAMLKARAAIKAAEEDAPLSGAEGARLNPSFG